MQFDARSRKQPVAGLDERALRADVHDNNAFAGTDAGGDDSVFVRAVTSWGSAPVHVRNCHSWFHCLVRTMNFSTRVLPVSPKTRTTYWAFWPRMYTLPDDDVPAAENESRLLDPSFSGSVPGGGPPSIPGRSGSTPTSTP